MRNEDTTTKKAWAYVHGEISEQERADIETETQHNEGLRNAIEEAQSIDGELRMSMSMIVWSEKELEDKLLRAWESADAEMELEKKLLDEYDREHPETESTESGIMEEINTNDSRNRSILYGPFGVVLSLAASLLIIFMVGVRNQQSSSMQWAPPEIVQAATYRGVDGKDVPSQYSHEQMASFSTLLRKAVHKSYDKQAPRSKKKSLFGKNSEWVMSARFQELREGKLGVQVKAYSSKGKKIAKEWNQYFADSETYKTQVLMYASDIADSLISIGTSEQGGS